MARGVDALGGRWEVGEEELASAAERVESEVKLSATVGLRKFILMIMFLYCVLLVGRPHGVTKFYKIFPLQFFVKNVLGEWEHLL